MFAKSDRIIRYARYPLDPPLHTILLENQFSLLNVEKAGEAVKQHFKEHPKEGLGGNRGQTDGGHHGGLRTRRKHISSNVRIFHFGGKRGHIRKCSQNA